MLNLDAKVGIRSEIGEIGNWKLDFGILFILKRSVYICPDSQKLFIVV
jgi:hypothetical protein